MNLPFDDTVLAPACGRIGISDMSSATIRQSCDLAGLLETETGVEFLHLEMGVPGLAPEEIGVKAEIEALGAGVASVYPNMFGAAPLKKEASRFLKAFLDVDVKPDGCIPTVGSMQGSFCAFLLCTALDPAKDTILFIDPGFPVQKTQTQILKIKSESFDIYSYRDEKLRDKLESYLSKGNIAAIIYSNPNNPAWICLTEKELSIIGELATMYDTVVLEDLAYFCMDFRKELGKPFQPPYQPTVARYTDNYMLMISGSKVFSYAGQRIAVAAISDKLRMRSYPYLKERFNMPRFADAFVLTILYSASAGVSHSAQYALAAMMKAASDGELDFVGKISEYGRRAKTAKQIFLKHGFHIVYDKDLDEEVSDGFFFTVGYGNLSGPELMKELVFYGICSIPLNTTGSRQDGLRVCVSQLNEDRQMELLDRRLGMFVETHKK